MQGQLNDNSHNQNIPDGLKEMKTENSLITHYSLMGQIVP